LEQRAILIGQLGTLTQLLESKAQSHEHHASEYIEADRSERPGTHYNRRNHACEKFLNYVGSWWLRHLGDALVGVYDFS
jgi:hypothetical protein